MNLLNEEDAGTSNHVHAFVRRMVADNAKHKLVAGSYCCAEDGGQAATLHGFIGTKILESNLQIVVAHRMLHFNPDLVSQEVLRICTARQFATNMIQSFIFPQGIVQELDAADHCANQEITSSALYTSIKVVITLMNGLNGIIKAGAMHGACVSILHMNLMSNMNVLEPPCCVP